MVGRMLHDIKRQLEDQKCGAIGDNFLEVKIDLGQVSKNNHF